MGGANLQSIDRHRPFLKRLQTADAPQQGTLAGTGGPDHHMRRPFRYMQMNVVEDAVFLKTFTQPLDIDHANRLSSRVDSRDNGIDMARYRIAVRIPSSR